MARANTVIGDVFSVELEGGKKKFFQYIANDLTQLNSDVIRAFRRIYPLDAKPGLSEIVNDEVDFYAHCVTKFGVKIKLWKKVGNISDIGHFDEVLFRESQDYGRKPGEESILFSHDWYIWKINDSDFTSVGKLEGKNRKAYIGLVFNPYGIIELLKGNKYPVNYPGFEQVYQVYSERLIYAYEIFVADTKNNPDSYSEKWYARLTTDLNYNCYGCALLIAKGETPNLQDRVSEEEFKSAINSTGFTDVSGKQSNYKFGETVISFGEKSWDLANGTFQTVDHAATYLGTSQNGAQYTWSKDGYFVTPKIKTVNQLKSDYNSSIIRYYNRR